MILAAGAATRMGRLKQVLDYGGGTLVRHAAAQALGANFDPVIVVVGAESEKVRVSLAAVPVQIAENPDWQLGMGSSIACGMRALADTAPDAPALAILLADQPLITAEHLRRMRAMLSPDSVAVAAEYGGSLGVPAIFNRNVFPALLSLSPHAGAKQLLRNLGQKVIAFPLPEGAADIDTPEDYARISAP
jgi:molybdenum cofactor cytidylyltransferase